MDGLRRWGRVRQRFRWWEGRGRRKEVTQMSLRGVIAVTAMLSISTPIPPEVVPLPLPQSALAARQGSTAPMERPVRAVHRDHSRWVCFPPPPFHCGFLSFLFDSFDLFSDDFFFFFNIGNILYYSGNRKNSGVFQVCSRAIWYGRVENGSVSGSVSERP